MTTLDAIDAVSPRDRAILRSILTQYADRIDRVAVFGSRATGRARANSDIDLALFGAIGNAEIDRLWTLFDDSTLSVSVDLVAYRDSMYPPLRRHIDAHAITLFDRDALTG